MTVAEPHGPQHPSGVARRKGRRVGRRASQAERCGSATAGNRQRRGRCAMLEATVPPKNTFQVCAADTPAADPQIDDIPRRCDLPQQQDSEAPPVAVPPGRTRRVSFDLEAGTQHEVTPYAEIYGLHPNFFLFERNDCILLLSTDQWGNYSPDESDLTDEGADEDVEDDEMEEIAEDGWVLVSGA